MIPYWLLFGLWSLGAFQAERARTQSSRLLFFVAAGLVTTFAIGLRFEVGGDWGAYKQIYSNIYFLSLGDAVSTTDIGYAAINWLVAKFGLGVIAVNLVCAVIFVTGFAYLCWRQANPALAMLVAVPYLIIVVAMGYTRQAAAIGVICYAIATASEHRLVRLVVLIGIAALMHKTAVLMLPVALYPVFRRNLLLGGIGFGLFALLFALLLRDSSDTLMTNYVQGDYDSQGALIRVSMNVVAGVFFLLLRDRFAMPPFQKTFWTACSLLSVLSLIAVLSASATAGIDRLSLYLIPLQAVTYSQMPYLLSNDRQRALPSVVLGVIAYSFVVQFVWLNYADNVTYWLPYKNALFSSADAS